MLTQDGVVRLRVLALIALGLLSRLPQLARPDLLLDGDECIMGLMARHLLEGSAVPIFFYGQAYGFSILEVLAAALAFTVLGPGTIALKLAMLAFWTLGVVLSYLALSSILGRRRGFWAAALLIASPAWALSSMNAYGGYITAFTLAALIFYLVTREGSRGLEVRALVIGAALAGAALARVNWLPGLLPLVGDFAVRNRRVRPLLSLGLGAAVTAGLIQLAAAHAWSFWPGPGPIRGVFNPFTDLAGIAGRFYTSLTGSYHLATALESGPATGAVAVLWCGVFAAGSLLQGRRIVTRRWNRWSHLLFLSTLLTLPIAAVAIRGYSPRYLLPFGQYLTWWIGVELLGRTDRRAPVRRIAAATLVVLLAGGAWSMVEFGKDRGGRVSERRLESRMDELLDSLEAGGVHHVFAMAPGLQWQLAFYSEERILARWIEPVDRYPPYPERVDLAFRAGEPTAVVGWSRHGDRLRAGVEDPDDVVEVAGAFVVYRDPGPELLRRLRYRMPPRHPPPEAPAFSSSARAASRSPQ